MTSTSTTTAASQVLLSELEHLAETSSGLPSTQQLYAIGGILFRIRRKHQQDSSDILYTAYQQLIDSLPESYLTRVFETYKKATTMLLESVSESSMMEDLISATEALSGLFSNSPRLCQLALAFSNEWMSILAAVYDAFVLKDASTTTTTTSQQNVVLSSVSFLLLDGLVLNKGNSTTTTTTTTTIEARLLEVIQAIEQKSTDCLRDLQAWQSQSEPSNRTLARSVKKLPTPTKDDDDVLQQREYILSMLESASQQQEAIHSSTRKTTAKRQHQQQQRPAPKPVSAADELERRIQQVKQILPDFGEGFLETALSLYQGDVETTMSVLLNDPAQYPSALRVLDRNLPRRRKERSKEEAEESVKARQLVKERVALEHQQEEAKYKALVYMRAQERDAEEDPQQQQQQQQQVISTDEYDDDYDDQYDEVDVKLGGADDVLDFEQVKLYNQVTRADEAEGSFWEDSRNTNRTNNSNNNNNNDNNAAAGNNNNNNEKKFRGPDKIKGGRVVGPDGKIVKKQGRGKKNNGNNSNPNNGNQAPKQQSQQPQQQQGKNAGDKQQQGKNAGDNQSSQQQQQKGKPKTKPRSDNRVNRQRDKKQKAQGTFGAQN
jgi:hypothetical protein